MRFTCVGAAFLRFGEGLLPQFVHVLRDGEEDAKVVCRHGQLADHADGLCARVFVNVVFPPLRLRVPRVRIVPGTTG